MAPGVALVAGRVRGYLFFSHGSSYPQSACPFVSLLRIKERSKSGRKPRGISHLCQAQGQQYPILTREVCMP